VTAIAGIAAAWGLTTLGLKLTGDSRVSVLMVAIWAIAPGSLVLSLVYAEALFRALAFWALVALADRRWLTAAGLTIAAGTVRSTAMALSAVIAVAALVALIQGGRTRQPIAAWWRPWWRPSWHHWDSWVTWDTWPWRRTRRVHVVGLYLLVITEWARNGPRSDRGFIG
jgi:hypothetical protein